MPQVPDTPPDTEQCVALIVRHLQRAANALDGFRRENPCPVDLGEERDTFAIGRTTVQKFLQLSPRHPQSVGCVPKLEHRPGESAPAVIKPLTDWVGFEAFGGFICDGAAGKEFSRSGRARAIDIKSRHP